MELGNKDLITTARLLAYEAHAHLQLMNENGDVRPQAVHLQEVADLVWASGGTPEEIAAAWLHDSVEDTPLTNDDVLMHCGAEVAALVHSLTDFDEWLSLSLLERKTHQAARVKEETDSVKRIKLCDQISNVRSITISRPTTMNLQDCTDYAEGARRIAESCRGIVPLLDALFAVEHAKAVERYGTVS